MSSLNTTTIEKLHHSQPLLMRDSLIPRIACKRNIVLPDNNDFFNVLLTCGFGDVLAKYMYEMGDHSTDGGAGNCGTEGKG